MDKLKFGITLSNRRRRAQHAHGQSAVLTALGLRGRVRVDDIEEIRIGTYRTALNMMGNDPSRWAPATHETADHSLPYVVATALLDVAVDETSFSEIKLRAAGVTGLMSRTKVFEDTVLTSQYPESSPCRMSIQLEDGAEIRNDVRYPKGRDRSG
jgi:2-methylcitrate dehydratase